MPDGRARRRREWIFSLNPLGLNAIALRGEVAKSKQAVFMRRDHNNKEMYRGRVVRLFELAVEEEGERESGGSKPSTSRFAS